MSTPEPTPSPATETPAVATDPSWNDGEPYALTTLDAVPLAAGDEYPLIARIGAEAFGSFALVLVAVGTLLYVPISAIGTLGVALATGLALAGLTMAIGHVSGAHLTPAVSIGAAITGRVSPVDAVLYVVAQVLGAVAAVAALLVTVPADLPAGLKADSAAAMVATTANGWGTGSPLNTLSQGQVSFGLVAALVVELLATTVVVAVVLSNRWRRSGAVAVGLTFAALLLVVAPVTNGALNPARATAVALVTAGATTTPLAQVWLFWLTGLLGGALAGLAVMAFGHRDVVAVDPDAFFEETTEDDETVRLA